jgi:hypothetical protein
MNGSRLFMSWRPESSAAGSGDPAPGVYTFFTLLQPRQAVER